jgi:hypothetical protein
VFVEADGELEGSAAWAAVAPPASATLVEGTAKLSKQLLGLDHKVLDPVQVAAVVCCGLSAQFRYRA